MLSPGDRVAHYTIESRLGAGGMGEVYLAVDSRLHRKVALKVILERHETPDSGSSERVALEASARLMREARAAASLTHPNVVSIFEVGEHEGRVYLAMEHVLGHTLREKMKMVTAWQKRLRWLSDVARALASAHKSGLVHRDIKPENVMVREDGIVKVLDFGIARRTTQGPLVDPNAHTESAGVSTLTGEGMIIGTPMYMAPEQLKGGVADSRTDQFAWGVMAYELLSGKRPWPDKNDLLAAVATILTEPPDALRDRVPELPHAVEVIVARTIARLPHQRFESMDEVADALEPLAASTSTSIASLDPATLPSPKVNRESVTPKTALESPDAKADYARGNNTKDAVVTRVSPEFQPIKARPKSKRRWHFVLGVATSLLAIIAYFKFGYKPLATLPTTKPSASPSGSQHPEPLPISGTPEAVKAYEDGLQLWRDGAETRSRTTLDRAIGLDDGLAAAHLLLTLEAMKSDPADAQAHFQKAFSHRASLSPRDRTILDSIAPLLRPTSDMGEAEAKLEEATKAKPREPLFWYLLGYVRQQRSDYERALQGFKEAVRLDSGLMPARRAEGDAEKQLGNVDRALAAYDNCIKASPAAATCFEERIALLRDRGECEKLEQDARSWQAVEPEAATASYWIAEALLARGAPMASVEAALKRQWEAMPKEIRATGEAEDRANIAIFQGDFVEAERQTHEWEKGITRSEVMLHARPQHQLALLAYETGDLQTAYKVSDDFLKVLPALTPDPLGNDPSLWFYEYLYRTGKLKKDELALRRKQWIHSQEAGKTARENQRMAPFRWAMIYAGFSETLDEAKDALDALPEYLPFPPDSRRTPLFDAAVGKTNALAGKYDDAIGPLTAVTNACVSLDLPELQTRSFYFLGLALEGKGELDSARKAYQTVIDRWGNAKPRSTTAEKAKARLKQLE